MKACFGFVYLLSCQGFSVQPFLFADQLLQEIQPVEQALFFALFRRAEVSVLASHLPPLAQKNNKNKYTCSLGYQKQGDGKNILCVQQQLLVKLCSVACISCISTLHLNKIKNSQESGGGQCWIPAKPQSRKLHIQHYSKTLKTIQKQTDTKQCQTRGQKAPISHFNSDQLGERNPEQCLESNSKY